MSKAIKVSGGFVVKRRARLEHVCNDCDCYIEPGEEYYQLSLEGFVYGYITKHICERCWRGRELKA